MDKSNLLYPKSLIRLSSTVFDFQSAPPGDRPTITGKGELANFQKSFRTMISTNPDAKELLELVDRSREDLMKALRTNENHGIAKCAKAYINPLNQLLHSLTQIEQKNQLHHFKLNEDLEFEWNSGIEKKKSPYQSKSITYELVMTIVTEAIATIGIATEECSKTTTFGKEKYVSAFRHLKKASGMFEYLEQSVLPQWTKGGTAVVVNKLPSEAKIGFCQAFTILTLGMAQQMAIALLLKKYHDDNSGGGGSDPNWLKWAEYSLGVAEQFETFDQMTRSFKISKNKSRSSDPDLFTIVSFQIKIQRAFSLYFHARHYWEDKEYPKHGIAIAMLDQAISYMKSILSSISKSTNSKMIKKDIKNVTDHMTTLLEGWDYDSKHTYFAVVPSSIPQDQMLSQGMKNMIPDEYILEEVQTISFTRP